MKEREKTDRLVGKRARRLINLVDPRTGYEEVTEVKVELYPLFPVGHKEGQKKRAVHEREKT